MDVDAMIQELQADVERIRRAIACLEQLRGDTMSGEPSIAKTRDLRGRKSMGVEERQEVSARMKRYWANRRNKQLMP